MKTQALLIFSALFFLGCVPQVDPPKVGLEIGCHSRRCPAVEEVQEVLDIVHEDVRTFDPDALLRVEWHASEEAFFSLGGDSVAIAFTESGSSTTTTSYQALVHELFHVLFFRLFDDGDVDHAEGEGPWSVQTDDQIAELLSKPELVKIIEEFEATAPQCSLTK